MEQFDVLQQYLHRKKGLVVAPEKTFTVGHSGHKITVEYIHPDYIHFYAEGGTPNDMFKIDHTGQTATFSSVATEKSFANASLLADHIEEVLKGLSEQPTTASASGIDAQPSR